MIPGKDVADEMSLSQVSSDMVPPASRFSVPVDTEHKSTVLRIWSFNRPHHMSFHMAWFAFFLSFISTFAPAALMPPIRDNLNLTKSDIGNSGIAAVCGAIFARIAMGNFVDMYGPRFGIALCIGLTSPCVFCMSMVGGAGGFIAVRFFIGMSLAVFVACQFWCSSMFTTRIVGTANAVAAGWGNMGGGFTALIMPAIFDGIVGGGVEPGQAWRWAFFVPGACQVLCTLMVLALGVDLPDGQYNELKAKGLMAKPMGWPVWKAALTNYRTWVMCLTYGYCFGVELTIDNYLPQYFFDQFSLSLWMAGLLASVFGLMNLFTRALGGVVSDVASRYFGMRGRLWAMWIVQTLGGIFCVVLGLVSNSLAVTMVIVIVFSIFCQMSCGLSFGIVPFVSKRSTGLVSGFVGAGGNAGSAVTQAIFFTYGSMSVPDAFKWMGVMTIGMTLLYHLMYFPMWGGTFVGPKQGVTEEDYYLAEYSPEERSAGLASASIKFAYESRSQRGGSAAAAAMEPMITSEPEKPAIRV